ncbi:excisionase [Leucobacter sp. UCD-THU]|uniref:DUF2637 domain-containing protein n=1 Tax=Leucobacter sp. UCD-THU TaxID=1292023 RepID=UPI0003741284|nr:DUF2637 domain-containing protein [Leucobacter sp. UCD-THU]EYT56586.1 excisionase [Leucobacter sp. UCD-THU]
MSEKDAPRRKWVAADAIAGTVVIGVGAFVLSFGALTDLAGLAGVPEEQAWIWAVIVDGMIVMATRAAFALDQYGRRAAAYPWVLLAASAGVSVIANIAHAVVRAPDTVAPALAGAIAAVPPLILISVTHLTVLLIRRTMPARPDPATSRAPELSATASHTSTEPRASVTGPPRLAATRPEVTRLEDAGRPVGREVVLRPTSSSHSGRSRNPGQRAEALRLHREGFTSRQIADRLDGPHRATVSRWIADAERRPTTTGPEPSTESENANA